jgi:hypothetical protein
VLNKVEQNGNDMPINPKEIIMKSNNLDFDGMAGDGVNRAKDRFAKNQWSGHSNDGRTVDFGRGPTKGNDGTHDSTCQAPTTGGAQSNTKQYRGVGGTAMPKTGKDSFNFGRGPTKGNTNC